MAYTAYGVNDALAVKLWSKYLAVEALKATDIAPLIGDSANSIVYLKSETQKSKGDKITCGLRMQLSQDGFTENEVAEGNGESLTTYSDSLFVNELGFNVGVKSENTIDAQRVQFDLRAEARDALSDHFAKRMSLTFFNQVCGNTAATDTKYTGLNATIAPTSTRIIRAGSQANDQSLTSSNTFTLDLIDKAVEMANTATPKIRPATIGGKKMFVCYLHDYQVTDLRINTSTGQWLDIQKAAMAGGQTTGNPIFTDALGVYHDVVLRKAIDIPLGCNSSTPTTAVSNTRRAVLLGAQAAHMAFGMRSAPYRWRWNEELVYGSVAVKAANDNCVNSGNILAA